MQRLKVKANRTEIAKATKLLQEAEAAPAIAITSAHALESGGFAGDAWGRLYAYIAEIAKVHGLPDDGGQYGIDFATREFIGR